MKKSVSFVDLVKQHIESGNLVLPVFSSSAMKVQQELVKKEPNLKIVEQMITVDQSLSSQILKLANSSFYRGLSEVLTIKAAIVRLGIQEIGRITLLAASKSQFRSSDTMLNLIMKRLWQHSVGVGMGANWLARRCNFTDIAGHAFFAGLLHDVGKLFVLLVLDDLKKRSTKIQFTPSLIVEAMENLHTRQGYALMQNWNMPEQYCEVARDHHAEEFDSKHTVLLLVRMANTVCAKLGIGPKREPDIVTSTAVEASLLNLSEIDLAELEIKLEDTKILAAGK